MQHSGAGYPRIAPLAPSGAKNARPGFPFTLSGFCEGFTLSLPKAIEELTLSADGSVLPTLSQRQEILRAFHRLAQAAQ